jgi:hypothetical protein
MALEKYLAPPKSMVLHHTEEYKEEGITPGLRFLPTANPSQSILLNATYNNYKITNHYRSREQIETNEKLKKRQKKADEAYIALQRKYTAAKKLLNRTMPFLSFVDMDRLDEEDTQTIIELKEKWDAVSEYKNKRKMEEEQQQQHSSFVEGEHNKRKTVST